MTGVSLCRAFLLWAFLCAEKRTEVSRKIRPFSFANCSPSCVSQQPEVIRAISVGG